MRTDHIFFSVTLSALLVRETLIAKTMGSLPQGPPQSSAARMWAQALRLSNTFRRPIQKRQVGWERMDGLTQVRSQGA
jgi:hypothetical protein